MPDISRIPFTEIFERTKNELVRDGTTDSVTENKYKGRVNDIYMHEIPSQIDYRHIKKTGTITTSADYVAGTVALTNGSATITGTSTVWTSANALNLLFKAGNYNELYRIGTFTNATSLALDRVWVEATDTSETYSLFQDRYALATDFDRMVLDMNRAVWYWSNGTKVYLEYKNIEAFKDIATTMVSPNPSCYTVDWVNDDPYLFIDPPSDTAMTLEYDYIPQLSRMTEYVAGTITTLANGSAAVTGSGTDFDGFVADTTNYAYYFRIDSDGTGSASRWYKIASAASDTSVTLSTNYEGTSISAGTSAYTISKVSLLPASLDVAIMYGTALISAIDQNAPQQIAGWNSIYQKLLGRFKSVEAERNYGQQRMRSIYEKTGVRR